MQVYESEERCTCLMVIDSVKCGYYSCSIICCQMCEIVHSPTERASKFVAAGRLSSGKSRDGRDVRQKSCWSAVIIWLDYDNMRMVWSERKTGG